jgi:hypothetical protein
MSAVFARDSEKQKKKWKEAGKMWKTMYIEIAQDTESTQADSG